MNPFAKLNSQFANIFGHDTAFGKAFDHAAHIVPPHVTVNKGPVIIPASVRTLQNQIKNISNNITKIAFAPPPIKKKEGWFMSKVHSFENKVGGFVNGVENKVGNVVHGVENGISSVVHGVENTASNVVHKAENIATGVANTGKNIATTVYHDATGAVKTVYGDAVKIENKLVNTATGLGNKVVDDVSSLGHSALNTLTIPLILVGVGVIFFAYNSKTNANLSYSR